MGRLLDIVFERRGYTEDFLKEMGECSNDKLKSMDDMIRALKVIHDAKEKIVVLPDFDTDGIMSGVIGFAGLTELGFNVSLYEPDPKHGYGFGESDIDEIIEQWPDVEAILTCDVGITCYNAVDYARAKGIKVLISDHHKQLGNINADVVVNPNRLDETYSHPSICGAYVLYTILCAYASTYASEEVYERIEKLVVFAGIGTVSDCMDMCNESRAAVKESINIMRNIYEDCDYEKHCIKGCSAMSNAFTGLSTLLRVFSCKLKHGIQDIDEGFYGYYLAPCFNSVKRMGEDVSHAFNIFLGKDSYVEGVFLVELNEQRKEIVEKCMTEIKMREQPYAYAGIYLTDAPAGICGLIAQRIMESTKTPVFALRVDDNGHYSGSGRSPTWFPIIDTFGDFYSTNFAGHNEAFGCNFKDSLELEDFASSVKRELGEKASKIDSESLKVSRQEYDLLISTSGKGDTKIDAAAFVEFVRDIQVYKPFGKGFEEPIILFEFNPRKGEWCTIGSENQHVKVKFGNDFELLLFNQGDKISLRSSSSSIQVKGRLSINTWHNKETVNFIGTIV